MAAQLPSFKSAAEIEKNIIVTIRHQQAAEKFTHQLWAQKESIESLVKHHLGLKGNDVCRVLCQDSWIQGGFNICVPVETTSGSSTKRFIFRCPLSHKLAENRYPGTVDEKVSSEVATYIWMQEYCPDIRIPKLFGFGFQGGSLVNILRVTQLNYNATKSRSHRRSPERHTSIEMCIYGDIWCG